MPAIGPVHRQRQLGIHAMLWGACLAIAARTARADDVSDIEGLLNESVITTASQSAETAASAPATSTTLTAEDLRTYGIRTIAEAIDFLSLGMFTSEDRRSPEVGARGVLLTRDRGNHLLLLVNGHAMNEALYGSATFGWGAGIPLEMIDHIEVILGPGSVLYGSNAMLGVVNVVTKRAAAWKGTHVFVESDAVTNVRGGAGMGYALGRDAELTLALDYYRMRGRPLTVGPQYYGIDVTTGRPFEFGPAGRTDGSWGGTAEHSLYAEAPSVLARLKVGNLDIQAAASLFKRASPFNSDFARPESDFDDPDNDEVSRHAWIDVKHRVALSSIVDLTSRLYGDSFDYRRAIDQSARTPCLYPVATCRLETRGVARWAGLEEQASFAWLRDARLKTLVGVDARIRHGGAQLDELDAATDTSLASTTGIIRETDWIVGTYLEQTAQPWSVLDLNAGARLDHAEHFGSRLSPRIAAAVRPWKGGTLRSVYAEAFRAPTWEESYTQMPNQLQAQNLAPETVRSVEASIHQKLGSDAIFFGAFRSWWTDLVELYQFTYDEFLNAQRSGQLNLLQYRPAQFRNVSSIDDYGLDAGYDGSAAHGRLRYAVNVTEAIARRPGPAGQSVPVVVAPRLFGNARVSYTFEGGPTTVALGAHYLASRPADRAYGAGFDPAPFAPAVAEIRATVSGRLPGLAGASYRASGTYATADRGAYVVGSNQWASQGPHAELVPLQRFSGFVGLQYDF
jgi:outer membrane receptor for ferrienterochelin and colicins